MLGFNLWSDPTLGSKISNKREVTAKNVLKDSNSPLKGVVKNQSSPTAKKNLIQSSPAQKIASPQVSQRFDRPVVHRNIAIRNSPLPKPSANKGGDETKPRTPMKLSKAAISVTAAGFDAATLDSMTTDLLNGHDEDIMCSPPLFSPTPPQREGPFNLLGREKSREAAREKEVNTTSADSFSHL